MIDLVERARGVAGLDRNIGTIEAAVLRECAIAIEQLMAAGAKERRELVAALQEADALIAIMFGRGPNCIIPETVPTPLGPPVKIGAIVGFIRTALARATGSTS